jgi:uncharacterized protein YoxC
MFYVFIVDRKNVPTELYIAVLVACLSIVIVAVVLVVTAVHFRTRMDSMEKNISQATTDLSVLIQETRGLVKEMQQVTARLSKPIDDVEHMTRTARGWTDRADHVIDAVGTVAEPPLLFLSKSIKTFGGIAKGVLQMLLAPKR